MPVVARVLDEASRFVRGVSNEYFSGLIDTLEALDMTGFDEFEAEANTAKTDAMTAMVAMRDAKQVEEDERARIKEEQERAKAEQERIQAEQAAEARRLEEQRDDIQRQRAELEAAKAAQPASVEPEPKPVEPDPKPVAQLEPVSDSAEFITDGDVAYLPVTMVEPAAPVDPTDADVIWIAAKAVADAYGWPTAEAINRLAVIDWQPA